MTSTKGWAATDVERWALPSSWVGDVAPVTLGEVRRAARRLAASWGLDLDEVVSFFWEALQSPGLATSDNKAAYVWRVVRRRVSTCAAANDLLQGEGVASTLKSDLGGGDGQEFVHAVRSPRFEVPFRGPVFDELTNAPEREVAESAESIPSVVAVISVLVDAGWAHTRATRAVESMVASAEKMSDNGVSGFEAIANRLRRRPGNGGIAGLSRHQWLALIRVVFGSRTGEPGVLPRVLSGEDPDEVAQCPSIARLAVVVTGGRSQVKCAARAGEVGEGDGNVAA